MVTEEAIWQARLSDKSKHIGPKPLFSSRVANLSVVFGVTGRRENGKTLFLTRLGLEYMFYHGQRVFSNYKIHSDFTYKGQEYHLRSEELDPKSLLTFVGAGDERCLIIIDELPLFCLTRNSASNSNKVLGLVLTQIRKRHWSLAYSAQNSEMIDKWVSFQTDIEIFCKDITQYTDKPGRRIVCDIRNLTGILPIGIYNANHYNAVWGGARGHKLIGLEGEGLWHCYDTFDEISIIDALRPTQFDLTPMVLTDKQPGSDVNDAVIVNNVVNDMFSEGVTRISSKELWENLKLAGVQGKPERVGRYLTECGLVYHALHGGRSFYELQPNA